MTQRHLAGASAPVFDSTADGAVTRLPAAFLVGPDLTLRRVHYGADASDHLTPDQALAWLREAPESLSASALARGTFCHPKVISS